LLTGINIAYRFRRLGLQPNHKPGIERRGI
jgi:hypothetical protein